MEPFPQEPEEVVRAYAALVYRLAYARTGSRTDADDIFQEVFFRYLRAQPRLASPEHQKAWFLRVTVNCCHKLFTSPWRKRTVPLEDQDLTAAPPEDPALQEALEALSPHYRTVIHLFYYEALSVDEIAAVLGRKPATVRTQLTRARRRLRALLEEESL